MKLIFLKETERDSERQRDSEIQRNRKTQNDDADETHEQLLRKWKHYKACFFRIYPFFSGSRIPNQIVFEEHFHFLYFLLSIFNKIPAKHEKNDRKTLFKKKTPTTWQTLAKEFRIPFSAICQLGIGGI